MNSYEGRDTKISNRLKPPKDSKIENLLGFNYYKLYEPSLLGNVAMRPS